MESVLGSHAAGPGSIPTTSNCNFAPIGNVVGTCLMRACRPKNCLVSAYSEKDTNMWLKNCTWLCCLDDGLNKFTAIKSSQILALFSVFYSGTNG